MHLCRGHNWNECLALVIVFLHANCSIVRGSAQQQQRQASNQRTNATTSDQQRHDIDRQQNSGAAGFLLSNRRTDKQLDDSNPVDVILSRVLDRVGPDTRPTTGFRDPQDISLEVARRAWLLMRQHAIATARGQLDFYEPLAEQILAESDVSKGCRLATQRVASAARRLESWSIQLLNSWGSFPPAGLFEGTLADIGSFHGCVNVPENAQIGHAHYCTLAYRPVMPTRRDYELVINREPAGLLDLFNDNNATYRDSFSDLINKAQYNHYVYFKLGACFPIDCTPFDVQKIAQLLGRSAILVSGPVKCHSRFTGDYERVDESSTRRLQLSIKDLNDGIYIWKPHITTTQFVSLIIICLLTGSIFLMTFVDLYLTARTHLGQLDKSGAVEQQQDESVMQLTSMAKKLADEEDPNNNNDSNNSGNIAVTDEDLDSSVCLNNHQRSLMTMIDTSGCPAQVAKSKLSETIKKQSALLDLVRDCSIIRNTQEFFLIGISQQKNDILCLNGLRCITMSWIIVQHTMQYNDWSAFARIYEIETHLKSLITQPLFNGSYLVDTFFLISGLLTSFSVFKICAPGSTKPKQRHHSSIRQIMTKFSSKSYLIGRYLRLTPQIMLVSLLFICLPLLNNGNGSPHWYTMTGEYSENCSNNWWINLFHVQAFYKSSEMCNFVCWWISVDMFYHLFALFIILVIFKYGRKVSFRMYSVLILLASAWQASQHYQMGLPPNLLATIPQTGLMWTEMVLKYFWLPQAHSFPFLLGFYLGYSMAQFEDKFRRWFTVKRALWGWLTTICTMLAILYSTHFWVIGTVGYTPAVSTSYYLVTQVIWSLCLSWVICACQFDHGGLINQILSCKLFIILGKASYIVYLSHFMVLFTFFGIQNILLEPTQILMTYVILGNVCLSMVFGSILCVVFEMPWLKIQRRIMRKLR